MNGRDDKRDRDARLAAALRQNLRRRKAQSRDRRDPAGEDPAGRTEVAPSADGQGEPEPFDRASGQVASGRTPGGDDQGEPAGASRGQGR
jgi:hypothetical protein